MKKRIGSLLLSLAMCLSLLPTTALAASSTAPLTSTVSKQTVMSAEAVMSAKNSPLGFDTKVGHNGTFNELYFGTFYADMTSENPTGRPHLWRILNTKTSVETDGLFLLSMDGYDDVRFTLPREVENGESWWLQPHNKWDSPLCSARLWCGELAKSDKVFSNAERGALLAVSKNSERYYPTSFGYFVSLYGSVLNGKLDNEKVFYLSAEEFEDSRYGLTRNGGDIGTYPLRSQADGAYYDSDAGMIYDGSIASGSNVVKVLPTYGKLFTGTSYSEELTATEKFFFDGVMDLGFFPALGATEEYVCEYNDYTAHPAMNLDGGKLLYFMAADNSGHTSFGKVADASTNWQWKATLLNSSDTAFKNGVTLTNAPDGLLFDEENRTVTVNHPALNTLTGGYNTVTAALLNAKGEPVCYGSVSTDQTATSTEVTLPDNIPDGKYTLRISAEQWNGAQVTDLAAQPFETEITSAGAHSHPICGYTKCKDEEHPAVAWMPVASTEDMTKMTADGYYFLATDVTAPETDVVGHLCTSGHAVTGTLHAGTDGLTLCGCSGQKNGNDVEAVAVAERGTYDQYGLIVGSLSAGNNCTLNIRQGAYRQISNGVESTWKGYATIARDKNGNALLGEGTVLNIYYDGQVLTDNFTPKLPKDCKIHVYGGALDAADTTNEGVKVFLHSGGIGTIRLGGTNSLVIDKDTSLYITSLSMAEGSAFTVPRDVTVAKLTEIAANAAITVEDGGKIKQVTHALNGSTITVEDGGTLGQVDAAEEGSNLNLHRCIGKIVEGKTTYNTIVSSGDVNLYGAVSGATFKVAKPLNICAPLGAAAEEPCTIDIMNDDHTPKLEGCVFTSGWSTHMADDADPGDYFSTPTAYMIAKNEAGELFCVKRSHEADNHPVCGATCTHSGAHTGVTWTELSDVGTSLNGGSYLLMTDVTRTASGGTVTVSGNVNICLNGYTLDLNKAHFELSNGAVLTICDCAGTGKLTNATGSRGRLVDVPAGTAFRLYGGELSGNNSATLTDGAKGGTVYVNGGTFTMGGGRIKEGIAVELVSGTLDLSGGTFVSSWYNGAAVWQTGGTATMTGGTIDADHAPVRLSGGTFTLSNGKIRNNSTTPVTVSGGTLQINGGSIVSAFYAVEQTGGTVNMTAGRVAGRYGVDITGGIFNMSGGTIDRSEIADSYCWGVRLKKDGTGTFNMSGGTITGYCQGGVELTDGTMTVSGTAKITGNQNLYDNTHGAPLDRNLSLASGKTITVDNMSSGAQIGITMADKTGVFSSGGSGASAFFTSDDADYTVGAEGGNLRLNGTVQNATVTKILVNGEEAGKNSDNEYCLTLEVGKSVRLSAEVTPANAAYTWYYGYSNAKITDGNLLTGVREDSSYQKVSVCYKGEVIGKVYVKVIAPTSYTVTYDMQDHGTPIDPLTATANATMTAPEVPTDTHYNFGGWFKDAACTQAWNFGTDKVTSDVTLYAKWVAKSYTMTLVPNGGTCDKKSVTLVYGQACSELPTPTRSGYIFDGWYDWENTKLTADTVLNKTFPETTAGRTLTAQWIATAPTVTKGSDLTLTYGYTGAGSVSVTATAALEGQTLSYQWYTCDDAEKTNPQAIDGATAASYAIGTGKSAGTYYYYCAVTATRGDNQQTATANSGVITVTVNKAARNAAVSMEGYTYGGTVSAPGISENPENGTVTYYYSTSNTNSGGTEWKNMTATTLASGTYYLYATIAETTNYGAFTTPAVSFTVSKADPAEITWPTLDPIYVNDILADGDLQNGAGAGTFTITGDKTWTESGNKTTTVTFTPSNPSYNTVTNSNVAVTVNKRTVTSVTTSISAITDKDYGTALGELGLPTRVNILASGNKTFTVPVTWSGYDPSSLTEQTLTGTLELSTIANEVAQPEPAVTATATVTLKELTPGNVIFSDKTETYTGNPISHTLASLPAGVASVAYTYAGKGTTAYTSTATAPTNAGTYTVTVTFTMGPGYATILPVSAALTINKASAAATAPTAVESLVYNGEEQTLVAAGSATGGTMQYRLGDSGNYSTDLPKAKDADTYTVYYKVVGDDNHLDSDENPIPVTIAPRSVTISGITAQNKPYDDTTEAWINTNFVVFNNKLEGDELTINNVAGTFEDANAGENKTVNLTFELDGASKDNYVLNTDGSQTTATANIGKAALLAEGTGTASGTYGAKLSQLTVSGLTAKLNGTPVTGTWKLSGETVPNVGDPETYTAIFTPTTGAGNYNPLTADVTLSIAKAELPTANYPTSLTGNNGNKLSTVTLPTGWTWVDGDDTVMNESGSKTFNANYAGSTNYKAKDNVALTVNVVNKTDVSDQITFADGSLTYTGSALAFETATITGVSGGTWTYTYAAGTGTLNSDNKPLTAGTYTVTAKYEDAANLGTATATLTVNKATPTGAPKYTAITTSGKKLSDAALTANESWPAGTVKWVDADGNDLADTTEVAANTAYKWLFTPDDTANYNTFSGTITLWHRSSGGSSAPVTPPTVTVPVSSDHATVEVKAEVSKGNATVEVSDKQIEQVANNGAGSVTVDVSGLKNVDSATVPSHVVEKTNEAENTGLTVALPTGSVTLDETALESVTESADGKDVTISVVAVPTTILPPAVKDIVGMEPTVAAVVDVNITVGSTKQSSFNGGKVTVSIPYTPKKGEDTSKLTVWFIRDDGTIENKGGYYDTEKKCFVFETEHLSQYLLVSAPVTFVDVPVNAYFYNAVAWAVDNGITGGTTSTTFSPYASCTRAQLVTFLYRYVQSQGGGFTGAWMFQLPFSDVPEWCYESVAWCYMNNIVGGYGNGLFGSNDTITREQMAVILYRFAQKTGLDTTQGGMAVREYSDYESISDYAVTAMQWAVNAGILQGHNNNLMPGQPCTRAQIVTMLYRLLGN